MVSLSMTFSDLFKVTTFFEVEYRKNGAQLHNGKLYQTYGVVWWPWLTYKRVACQAACAIERTSRPPVCLLYRQLRQQAACRQPAAGGSTERGTGRQRPAWQATWNWTHLSPGPWFQAKTQQPIGVVGPVIIHVNGLAIWLRFVDMLPAALIVDVSVVRLLCVLFG